MKNIINVDGTDFMDFSCPSCQFVYYGPIEQFRECNCGSNERSLEKIYILMQAVDSHAKGSPLTTVIQWAMTEYAHRAIEEAAASALDSHMSNAPGNTIVDEILKLKEKY